MVQNSKVNSVYTLDKILTTRKLIYKSCTLQLLGKEYNQIIQEH